MNRIPCGPRKDQSDHGRDQRSPALHCRVLSQRPCVCDVQRLRNGRNAGSPFLRRDAELPVGCPIGSSASVPWYATIAFHVRADHSTRSASGRHARGTLHQDVERRMGASCGRQKSAPRARSREPLETRRRLVGTFWFHGHLVRPSDARRRGASQTSAKRRSSTW